MKVKVNGIEKANLIMFNDASDVYNYGDAYIHVSKAEYGKEPDFPEVFDINISEKGDKKAIHLNPRSGEKEYEGVVYFAGFSGKSSQKNGYKIVSGRDFVYEKTHYSSTGMCWSSEFVIVLPNKEAIVKIAHWQRGRTGTDFDEIAVFSWEERKDVPAGG